MALTNARAGALKPSETLAVKARAEELRAQGKKILDLSTGEPEIDTPDHIKEAALKALKEGKTKYTAVGGILPLREAIADKLGSENGLKYAPDQIIVTNGGKQAIQELFDVTLEQGDEVIIPTPYWVSYPPMVELARGKPVIIKTSREKGYKLSPQELERAITPKTKWIVFNSPSNPTGVAYSAEEQRAFGQVIERSKALVMSDEVYERLVYGGFVFKSFAKAVPSMFERTVTVNSFSKTYSMTGWRVGYAAGPKEIISAMNRYQSQTTSNVNTFAEYGAIAALKGPTDYLAGVVESYSRRLEKAIEAIKKIPGLRVDAVPRGAFYVFVGLDDSLCVRLKGAGSPATQVVNHLLNDAGIAAVPGDAFGDDRAFRISVGCADATIDEALKLMQASMARLN